SLPKRYHLESALIVSPHRVYSLPDDCHGSSGCSSARLRSLSKCSNLSHRGLMDPRSEEHTSELQSPYELVCRLLLEKKNIKLLGLYVSIAGGWINRIARFIFTRRASGSTCIRSQAYRFYSSGSTQWLPRDCRA